MYTVSRIVTEVSRMLNDQRNGKEFTRWTREDILFDMNLGLKEIGTYRPEAFATTVSIPLVKGAVQQAPDAMVIENILTSDGKPVHKAKADLLKAFGAYAVCEASPVVVNGRVDYRVRSFARDAVDPSTFYVSPPVPAGVQPVVKAQTNSQPPQYTLADWNNPVRIADKYLNSLIDYTLARAYLRDTESQVAASKAQRIFQLFYQVMGTKYKIDSARNSGYYLGQMGSGDPRSAM